MDLVEVVLRAVGSERYLENFKQFNIGPECLKLLSEADLEIIGIEDVALRKKIIDHCKALVVKFPEKSIMVMDTGYIREVLQNMDKQLYFHYNNLVLSACRNDIILYNVKLGEAGEALRRCVGELKKETKYIKQRVITTKGRDNKKVVLLTLASVGFILGVLIRIVNK